MDKEFNKGDMVYRCGFCQLTDAYTVLPYEVIAVVKPYYETYLCLDDGDYGVFMARPNSYFKTKEEALRHEINLMKEEVISLENKKKSLQDLLESYIGS